MKTAKPVILTFVGHYLPGYRAGGPVRSIVNMVEHLGAEFEFRIVTSDRDLADTSPYPGVRRDEWIQVGQAQVWYTSPAARSAKSLARLIRQTPHDIVYLNSFFDLVFAMRPLLARRLGRLPRRPTIIAPRGQFSAGALQLKRVKKLAFLRVAKVLALYDDLIWQASSEFEVDDIRRVMGVHATCVETALNLPGGLPCTAAEVEHHPPGVKVGSGPPLRVVFLSRISPKKNLDFALSVLAQVRVPVQFDIYGPVGDIQYWKYCRGLIPGLPSNISAEYLGGVSHEDVQATLGRYDVFFLPTRGENYGHVVAEALSAGLPILIADTTPWRGLEEAGVGWDLPLTEPDAFRDALHQMASLAPNQKRAMRVRSAEYAWEKLADPEVVAATRRMFFKALNDPTGGE